MHMSIFERARQNAAKIAAEQQEAGITPKEAGNDNPSPLEQLAADRAQLEQRIAASGEPSTVEDREMLEDLDRRIALLKEAA